MDKLTMAHEYFMKHGRNNSWMESDVIDAWKYADAMQSEADKREPSGFPNVLRGACGEIVAVKVDDKEWQPDWSQAPDDKITHWTMEKDKRYSWWTGEPKKDSQNHYESIENANCSFYGDAPSFNYQGNWQDSLRKRPQ